MGLLCIPGFCAKSNEEGNEEAELDNFLDQQPQDGANHQEKNLDKNNVTKCGLLKVIRLGNIFLSYHF